MARSFLPDLFGRQPGPDLFTSLQREIDQVFRDFTRGVPALKDFGDGIMKLRLNVAETPEALEVTADLPGVDPQDIDVQLKEGVLTIRGEKKIEKEEKEKDYHLVERSYGKFERSFSVPSEIQENKIEASFDKGVLKVTLPKAPEAQRKTQKIEVKSAA